MGDVLQQATLRGDERVDAFGHLIEGPRQIAQLVGALRLRAGVQIAGAESLDDGHLLERERTLEELPAVKTAAEDEVAFKESACLAEE
jgi:hypothetical protein